MKKNIFKHTAAFIPLAFFIVLSLECTSSTPAKGATGTTGQSAENVQDTADVTDETIASVYDNLSKNLGEGLRIALIPVYPSPELDKPMADYVTEQLYIRFINSSRYQMTDRADIDKAITEQQFQTEYVNNDNAVQIGKLLGAQAVVIGTVEGKGVNRRIVMRALEVNTGRILTMFMEQITVADGRAARAQEAAQKLAKELEGKVRPRAGTAFFPLTVNGITADHGNFLFDAMSMELANNGDFALIEKQKLLALLNEYDFQMSGMVGVRTIGQLLGADVVIFGIGKENEIELAAVDVAKFGILAEPGNNSSAGAQTLILPVIGVQAEEARTIVSFITMTGGLNAIDRSRDTELVPARGRPWGVGPDSRQGIADLISRNNAQSAVGVSVTPYGTGKMASVRTFNSSGRLEKVTDIQYTDPFEFWIKLQQPVATTRRGNGGPVWVIYRQGVNRAEAEELISLWLVDLVSMGSQGLKELDDQTAGFEAAMAALSKVEAPEAVGWAGIIDGMLRFLKKPIYEKEDRSGGPGYNKIRGWDNVGPGESSTRYFRSIINRIPEGYAKGEPALVFDVSRQGNGTRIEVIRNRLTSDSSTAQGSFIVTYSSAQEFRRTLRANSLRLVNTLYLTELEYARDDVFRSTWTTSSALTELKTNVAVPNTFIQVKRPPAAPGEIPRGGFYMTKNQITQREWEALMGFNNSTVKGANLPVHIVSLAEAMEYCNRASLRDGLMPAYDVFFWEGLTREVYINEKSTITEYGGQTAIIRTNKYANGYRLPTADEWEFALTGGVGTYDQLVSELVKSGEITNVGWFEPNSNGRPQPVGQKRAINGFYDMLGNVTEYVFDGIPVESRRMGFMREGVKAEVRGGDYKNTIIGATDFGRGSLGETISLPSPTRREYEIRTWFKDGSYRDAHAIPGFRIVRPVFDYWAYRSGE